MYNGVHIRIFVHELKSVLRHVSLNRSKSKMKGQNEGLCNQRPIIFYA